MILVLTPGYTAVDHYPLYSVLPGTEYKVWQKKRTVCHLPGVLSCSETKNCISRIGIYCVIIDFCGAYHQLKPVSSIILLFQHAQLPSHIFHILQLFTGLLIYRFQLLSEQFS